VTSTAQGAAWRSRMGVFSTQQRQRQPQPALWVVNRGTRSTLPASAGEEGAGSLQEGDVPEIRKAGDALCWGVLYKAGCQCGGEALHLPAEFTPCAGHLAHVLGQQRSDCSNAAHPHHIPPNTLLALVLEWWGPGWEYLSADDAGATKEGDTGVVGKIEATNGTLLSFSRWKPFWRDV
jgi:hypothetical protein